MKRSKLYRRWFYLTIVLALLSISTVLFFYIINKRTDIVKGTKINTSLQNNSLGYDEEKKITLVGTYNNKLLAYDEESRLLWSMEGRGPFRQLVVNSQKRVVYAGNEDNFVYTVDLDTGEILHSIDVERRIYDIDVTRGGEEILVSAGVNTAKHNILIYSSEGELINNLPYKTQIKGVSYSADETNIIFVNNRGEIIKIDKEGQELGKIKTKYELVDLTQINESEHYAALLSDGSFAIIDENMNLIGSGKPKTDYTVTAEVLGTDAQGEHIIIGTKEGFLYILNRQNQQIFSTRLMNTVTGIMSVDQEIYISSLSGNVLKIDSGSLNLIDMQIRLRGVLQALMIIFPVMALFSLCMAIQKARQVLYRIGKTLYKHRIPYLLLLPTFLLLIFFNYTPVFIAVTRAFTNWSKDFNTLAEIKFVGLDNFRIMISEGYFLIGLGNLALMLVFGILKILTVPVLIAWLVYSMNGAREKFVFRFLFVLPMVVPGIVSTLMWQQIYDPTIGLINQVLGKVGLENLQRVWLGNPKTAIWAIIFMGFPFINALAFLVYYGGFISIDASLMEASKVDGATRWKVFWSVQLPMISAQIKMMIVLTFIGIVQDFSSVYILTGGGPGTSTYVPGLELYYNATKFGRYGYACALGLVMFVFIMIGTIINMRSKAKND
ncbi:MAG TPA: ABC transporter permease subunit [Clostridiales bacterium]|nr:ABC transporter permease subunit [Clostridiales bacterium]